MSKAIPASDAASAAYGVSAGLDVLSGVFGYLSAMNVAAAQQSRADLIRSEAEANAQRYQEQAAQFEAHEKVMYLASGVTLAGSPVDALATTARIAKENADAIRMAGDRDALNAENAGTEAEMKGREALISGIDKGVGLGFNSYVAANGGTGASKGNAALGVLGELWGGK